MSSKSPPSRHYLEDLLSGEMRSRSLILAHRLGVFVGLSEQSQTPAQLAATLEIQNLHGLRKLLTTLEGLQLVSQTQGQFTLTEIAREGLLPGSLRYYGEFIDFFADQFEAKPVAFMEQQLRTGNLLRPVPTADHWTHYMLAMDRMAIQTANRIARTLQMEDDRTLLDLGGGPGCYAIAACQQYEQLQATILDLPDALSFAEKHVAQAGLGSRITCRPGSVTEFSYGGPYDVIFLSHTIHLFDESTVQQMFAACRAALSDRGRLVVRDLFTDEHRTDPLLGSLIGLHMWNEGDAYSVPQTTQLLDQAGFQPPVQRTIREPGEPQILGSLLVASHTAPVTESHLGPGPV